MQFIHYAFVFVLPFVSTSSQPLKVVDAGCAGISRRANPGRGSLITQTQGANARNVSRIQLLVRQPAPYQVFQRGPNGTADINIEGMYVGQSPAIEARWNDGPWVRLVQSNGDFSGVLKNQKQGQGTLQVRSEAEIKSIPFVGIGDVFLVAGQSNAEGRISEPQSYQHPTLKAGLFDEAVAWRELKDPTDATSPGLFSIWPLLATEVMRDQNVPVAFITAAAPQSGLTNHGGSGWDPLPPTGPGPNLLNALSIVKKSGVNGLKVVLWYQGENDAVARDMSAPFYESRLRALQKYFARELRYPVRLMVWQLAAIQGYTEQRSSLDAVREAQANVWSDPNFLPGPVLYDLDIITDGDRVHLKKPEHAKIESTRAWTLLKSYLYGATPARGPSFLSARMVGQAQVRIDFKLNAPLDSVPINGWRVTDTQDVIRVVGAVGSGDSSVILTLERGTMGEVRISWASYNDAVGVRFWDRNDMPVEPFINKPVSPL